MTENNKLLTYSIALNIILILLASYITLNYFRLSLQNQKLNREVADLNNKINVLNKQLKYYLKISNYMTNNTFINFTSTYQLTMKFHAVAVSETKEGYAGVVINYTLTIIPGTGKLLINTQPKVGIELQSSLQIAKIVTQRYTNLDLNNIDIILSVEAPEEVEIVDGPSAGAVITATLISTILNKSLNYNVYLTGTINPDGTIGKVGGILEKALAIAELGAQTFLVPAGQENVTVYVEVKRQIVPGFYIITYEPKEINVEKYLKEKGYDIKVIGVRDIEDVLNYLWKP